MVSDSASHFRIINGIAYSIRNYLPLNYILSRIFQSIFNLYKLIKKLLSVAKQLFKIDPFSLRQAFHHQYHPTALRYSEQ